MKKILTILILNLITLNLFAGGLDLVEYGSPSSVGSAGNSNLTNTRDATILMTNPAGMSFTEGSLFTTGLQILTLDSTFDNKGSGNTGNNGGQIGTTDFMPTAYYLQSLDENWHFGIGMNSHTGLGLNYNDAWVGRYAIQNITLATIQITPSLSYKVNEKLSFGGSLVIDYAAIDMKVALNRPGLLSDGQMEYDDDDFAFGFVLGTMYKPIESTTIGLTYHSEIEHEFSGSPDFANNGVIAGLLLSDLDLDMTIPQMVKLGIRHELDEKLAILVSGSWEEWSRFGEVAIQTTTTGADADRNYKDTWGGGIAFEYQLNDEWLLSTGYRYDTSPVEDDDRTADLPADRLHRIGFGAEYAWSEDVTIGAAYSFVDMGTPSINQSSGLGAGNTRGNYDSKIHIITFGFTYRF
ncbi:MAG: outer membrane protein transport protein [Lentisphaeraceae bacterium]|nr:outer membrane protein transport protein [Lentisphaeraceae bacterium]